MRIKNASFLRTSELNRLVQFVIGYTTHHELARIHFRDADVKDHLGRPTCGGVAYKHRFDLTTNDASSLVEVGPNPNAQYPRTQRLMARTPELHFANWQEEIVVVLAHELRHIDQFWTGSHPQGAEVEAEIDAENFAAAVLEEYRRERDLAKAA